MKAMNDKSDGNNLLLMILTPFILLLFCVSVLIVCSIKPYNKISTLLNLVFMDEFRANPDEGLIIRDNDIVFDYSGETSPEGDVIRPSFGEQFASLRADALGQSVPVYWGSSREIFKRGACQASYSKLPGEKGRAVISAHEDTFFSGLADMNVGDTVTLYTNYGEFVYTVREKISFESSDNTYVNTSENEEMVLYTCKKDVLGPTDTRVGVICDVTEKKFYVETSEDRGN